MIALLVTPEVPFAALLHTGNYFLQTVSSTPLLVLTLNSKGCLSLVTPKL